MFELSGKIQGVAMDFFSGETTVTFVVNEDQSLKVMYDELHDCDRLTIKVDKWRMKRSLNANNYCWHLLTEIADLMRMDKEQLYVSMLKRYGQSEMFSVLESVPIQNYVKYYELAGESTLNGKTFKHYKVYKGSSEFDTREMSIFLDGIVSEAKELGIQTGTEKELSLLKAEWSER